MTQPDLSSLALPDNRSKTVSGTKSTNPVRRPRLRLTLATVMAHFYEEIKGVEEDRNYLRGVVSWVLSYEREHPGVVAPRILEEANIAIEKTKRYDND